VKRCDQGQKNEKEKKAIREKKKTEREKGTKFNSRLDVDFLVGNTLLVCK
jgi:hypothetical protein